MPQAPILWWKISELYSTQFFRGSRIRYLLFVTTYFKFAGLKWHIFCFTISVNQESESSLAGWFWPRISFKPVIGVLTKAALTWGMTAPDHQLPTPSFGFCQEASPHHVDPFLRLFSLWLPQSEWSKRGPGPQMEVVVFLWPNLESDIPLLLLL